MVKGRLSREEAKEKIVVVDDLVFFKIFMVLLSMTAINDWGLGKYGKFYQEPSMLSGNLDHRATEIEGSTKGKICLPRIRFTSSTHVETVVQLSQQNQMMK